MGLPDYSRRLANEGMQAVEARTTTWEIPYQLRSSSKMLFEHRGEIGMMLRVHQFGHTSVARIERQSRWTVGQPFGFDIGVR